MPYLILDLIRRIGQINRCVGIASRHFGCSSLQRRNKTAVYHCWFWVSQFRRHVSGHTKIRILEGQKCNIRRQRLETRQRKSSPYLINGAWNQASNVRPTIEDEWKAATETRCRLRRRECDLANRIRFRKSENTSHLVVSHLLLDSKHGAIEFWTLPEKR